jgi:hypothetical protein
MADVTFQEMVKKYGDVELTFSNYYKYLFTFTGTAPDGVRLMVTVGGIAEGIYQFEVIANDPKPLRDLDDPSWLHASDAEGNKIGEWWSDYW